MLENCGKCTNYMKNFLGKLSLSRDTSCISDFQRSCLADANAKKTHPKKQLKKKWQTERVRSEISISVCPYIPSFFASISRIFRVDGHKISPFWYLSLLLLWDS